MRKVSYTNGQTTDMAEVQSGGHSGYQNAIGTIEAAATIDNLSAGYWVWAYAYNPDDRDYWPNGIEVMGVVITYTTDEAD